MTNDSPEFISVVEAARRIGVGRDAGYRLVKEEGLPVVQLRGRMRVPVRALEQWIQQRADEALRRSTNR